MSFKNASQSFYDFMNTENDSCNLPPLKDLIID